jgi:DNA-binding PadR family transcriptional regulator
MRRKAGTLVPLEAAICRAAVRLGQGGRHEFHGYEMARHLGGEGDQRLLTAYGTLYRALGRLEEMGLLKSRREDPRIAARENRPLRRLYTLTALGERAVEALRAVEPSPSRPWRRRPVPA